MSHTDREKKLTSIYSKKLDVMRLKVIEQIIISKFYKNNVGRVTSLFYDELKLKYPKIYKEIRDICIEKYGKPLNKKEFVLSKINEINETSKGKMTKKRLKKRFRINDALHGGQE